MLQDPVCSNEPIYNTTSTNKANIEGKIFEKGNELVQYIYTNLSGWDVPKGYRDMDQKDGTTGSIGGL